MTAFVKDAWYIAAQSNELERAPSDRALLARMLLREPVVLYRREDGTPVALEDRCCHRHLPLSMGKLEGDRLRCGYHGLLFAPDGRCVEIPGQASVPPQARVRAYPVVEKFRW